MELDLTECYCRPYAQDDEDSGTSAADVSGSDRADAVVVGSADQSESATE